MPRIAVCTNLKGLMRIRKKTCSNPSCVRIYCLYCRCTLHKLEVQQLFEEEEERGRTLFRVLVDNSGGRVRIRYLASCSKCRLFLENA